MQSGTGDNSDRPSRASPSRPVGGTQSLSWRDVTEVRLGLLVTAALTRYDGAIVVEPADPPWAKAVAVRFFRAFQPDDEIAREERETA